MARGKYAQFPNGRLVEVNLAADNCHLLRPKSLRGGESIVEKRDPSDKQERMLFGE